jgi:hypothetical protein
MSQRVDAPVCLCLPAEWLDASDRGCNRWPHRGGAAPGFKRCRREQGYRCECSSALAVVGVGMYCPLGACVAADSAVLVIRKCLSVFKGWCFYVKSPSTFLCFYFCHQPFLLLEPCEWVHFLLTMQVISADNGTMLAMPPYAVCPLYHGQHNQ